MAAPLAGAVAIRPLHALELRVDPGLDPEKTAASVHELALGWIAEALEVGRFSLPREGGEVTPARGNRVALTVDAARGGWLLRWTREGGPGTWDAGVRLRAHEAGAEVALLVRGSGDGPWRNVRRPGFARALVDRHRCESGGLPLPPTPTVLGDDDVGDFVEEVLLAPGRRLPVVLVSADDATGRPLSDPDALADRLAGLARVFVLDAPRTSYQLTRALGDKVYSCFLGAVRLYLPGFDLKADPYDHPLTLPDPLRRLIARGGSAGDVMLAELMSRFPAWARKDGPLAELLAAMPVREPRVEAPEREMAPRATLVRSPSVVAAQEAAAARAVAPPVNAVGAGLVGRVKELMEENRELLAGIEELERRFEEFEAYQRALEEEQTRLDGRVQELGERNVELDYRIEELLRENAALRHELEALGGGAAAGEPEDLLDAVRRAARAFEDRLIFHPAAFASAEDSPYRHPGKALRALTALAEATEERRRSIEARTSVGNLRDHFEARGVEYKSGTSRLAKGQWAGHYQVSYGGGRVELDEHLAFGDTHDPAGCLRIYFFWDEANRTYVVAHCGRHKPNTKS